MSSKVAQSMTVTENTASEPARIAFNIQVLKTKEGVLKLIELVIEIICLNILVTGDLSNLTIEAAFAVGYSTLCFLATSVVTSLLLVSYLMSPMAESVLPKTIFELVSNVAAFVFFITTGLSLLIMITKDHHEYPTFEYSTAVAVMGIINGILYALSSYFSFKTFKST